MRDRRRRAKEGVSNITNREYTILMVVDKFRILRALDIAWLAGYTDESYCRKILRNMVKSGLMNVVKDKDGYNCYFLTGKGLREIGKESHIYEITYTTNHALDVARLGTYLYITKEAAYEDMFTDSDLRKITRSGDHRPDIVLGDTAYEVELNHKKQQRLIQNITSNSRYPKQLWVVPNQKKFIAKQLLSAAKYALAEIEILSLEQIYEAVSNADIHLNTLRHSQRTPVVPPPATVSRNITKYFGGQT